MEPDLPKTDAPQVPGTQPAESQQTPQIPELPNLPVFVLPPMGPLDVYIPARPPERRRVLPLVLFGLTCVTTFAAGVVHWNGSLLDPSQPQEFLQHLSQHWLEGLEYMVGVIGILLAHEMGHFLMTLRHRVPASFPYFIPMPVLLTGTMGAVIKMDGSRADRKQVFDIGLAGPLLGLVIAVPLLCLGIAHAGVAHGDDGGFQIGQPLLVKLLLPVLRPDLKEGVILAKNPLLMAAWFGMLITGLNMMPVSQLDGGHVIYGLFGRHSKIIARAFLLSAIGYMVFAENYFWFVMVVLVTFLGVDHPPTYNDNVKLGPWRYALGVLSLAIPVLCFMPTPFIE